MIKSVDELKELIEWAAKTRVKSLKVGDIEVQLSDLAFLDSIPEEVPQKDASTTTTPDWSSGDAALDKREEEEILFHSSR